MKLRQYVMGKAKDIPITQVGPTNTLILEAELDDGRTVQFVLNEKGDIDIRGWGNIPKKVGNSTNVEIRCQLNYEEPPENWREKYGVW